MKKLNEICLAALIACTLLSLCACGCKHEWQDATCMLAKTCTLCGERNGDALGHKFTEATCTAPKTCSVCGETEGSALPHEFSEATYDTPQTCKNCGITQGNKLKLSSSYDKLLASGYDSNDNYYEMVANETEDYTGIHFEIGIIKNNNWILEPTSNMPFILDENMFKSNGPEIGTVHYIGNGCFMSEKKYRSSKYDFDYDYMYIVYNAENGLSYSTANYGWTDKKEVPIIKSNSDDYMIIGYKSYSEYTNFTILNKTNMSTHSIKIDGHVDYFNNVSEGLFPVGIGESNYPSFYFFDTQGIKVLDLSQYKTTSDQDGLYFANGKCALNIINDNDTKYTITIDKAGNVVNQKVSQ